MIQGMDTITDCSEVINAINAAGLAFVGRYYANSGKKVVSATEALALTAANLRTVAIREDGKPTRGSYFSYSKGVDDGTSAYQDGSSIGQPLQAPIYFAVDYDPNQAEVIGCICGATPI